MKINELLSGGKTGAGLDQATDGCLLKYQPTAIMNGVLTLAGRTGTVATTGRTGTLTATGRTPTMEVAE